VITRTATSAARGPTTATTSRRKVAATTPRTPASECRSSPTRRTDARPQEEAVQTDGLFAVTMENGGSRRSR
jgi:hypothetical protein